jgi:transcriptional regulator with PAS, ATPase and Fis domain
VQGPTHADVRLTQIAVRAVHVEVTEGPNAGLKVHVTTPVFVIGTGDLADLRLTDPTVSREHVRLHLSANGVVLRDEGSRNGTWMGGLRVHHATLTTGARITLGSTVLTLHVDAAVSEVEVSASGRFGDALGGSASMRVVFGLLERAAPTELSILLEGESGVGKEILASSIHKKSLRKDGPFVTVDCSAIPEHLIESELFGHVRGAFTGAGADRDGLFAEAHGGTLFLDELGELPVNLQPKLLRALEQRQVRPVGSNRVRSVDVRVIAATNRQLAAAVEAGEFRQDLLYRLSVVRVHIPPLRDRVDDILPIARSFLASARRSPEAYLPPEIEGMLVAYSWPGNVRELRNAVQRFAVLGTSDAAELLATESALPHVTQNAIGVGVDPSELPFNEARQRLMDHLERTYLKGVLDRCGGVVSKAVEHSGLSRATFYRMLDRHQLTSRARGA